MKFLKRGVIKLLSRQPTKLSSPVERHVQLLKQSGKFDREFYLASYPDVALHATWRDNPEQHYLEVGVALGFNPNKWFDTNWYMSQYSDVAGSGMNPLLHYVNHGQHEKRAPNPRKISALEKKQSGASDVSVRLVHHLWGGLSTHSLAEMTRIYKDEQESTNERWEACWQAARWHFFVDDIETAYKLGLELQSLDASKEQHKGSVLLRGFCELRLNLIKKAEQTFAEYLIHFPQDSDIQFALSNCFFNDDQKRLQCINQVFNAAGLADLSLINPELPLSIANIKSKAAPVYSDVKVSVIMPVFNAAGHLEIAVRSLLCQSWKNLEIIIVDDCSTDETFNIALRLSAIDQRVIAIRQQVNSGAYPARNLGLQLANGDYITTHDSDDWSHPQKLETQLNAFRDKPQLMGLCTYWIRVTPDLLFTQNWRANDVLVHWSQSSFMFRRQVFEQLGGWDEVRVSGDTEFIWRMKATFGKSSYAQIEKHIPFAFALDDAGSLTRTKATHVRTVYYGLRHIYREICAWWHRSGSNLNIQGPTSRTKLTIPIGMQFRDGRSVAVDVVIASDYCDATMSMPLFALINQLSERDIKVGLLHWPNFELRPGSLLDGYFDAIHANKALPVVSGEQIELKCIVFADEVLLRYQVDTLPGFIGMQTAIMISDLQNDKQFNFEQQVVTSVKVADALQAILSAAGK